MEKQLTNLVTRIAPWLATLPTAYTIGLAVNEVLGWHWTMAWVTGIAVETVGVASGAVALELYAYQQNKRKTDPPAPINLGVAMVALYLAATIVLTVVLKRNLLLAVFPLLSIVGIGNLALRIDHTARLDAIASAKEERKQTVAQPAKVHVAKRSKKGGKSNYYNQFANHPDAISLTPNQIVEKFNVSPRTAYYWLQKYKEAK